MKSKPVFVDTNILVYAHDRDAGDKHRIAREKVEQLWDLDQIPVISVQVLQEFYVNLARKGVPEEQIRQAVADYMQWRTITNDAQLLVAGMDLKKRWQVSLWDALILAAAGRAKVGAIWSEDFKPGQKYDGIEMVNPLA